jgi:hypothetical protein
MGEGRRILPTASGRRSRTARRKVLTYMKTVFLDRSLPIEVRYLAIIQLKNGIDKYWRKTATKYGYHYT